MVVLGEKRAKEKRASSFLHSTPGSWQSQWTVENETVDQRTAGLF